jgi:threonine/homoserine/homoserine lactone efflux protein
MYQSFWTFFVLCLLLTMTPGADTALVLKSSMQGHRKLFIATIVGICSGLLFHATMSSLGLSAILQKSAELYSIVKLLGACYLIYLGGRALYEVWVLKSKETEKINDCSPARTKRSALSEFRVGLLTNILNPKVAVFYLTFLPQFIDPSSSVLLQSLALALVHILLSFVWLLLIGFFVAYFKNQLEKPSVKRIVESVTGLALLGFGIRLATNKN